MMALHELGHVVGAVPTGGSIECVVLHPMSFSRTDVSPNLHPAIVVWLGPIVGCIGPLMFYMIIPNRPDQPPRTVPVVKLLFASPLGEPLHFVEA